MIGGEAETVSIERNLSLLVEMFEESDSEEITDV
jgi:hypothetical protein